MRTRLVRAALSAGVLAIAIPSAAAVPAAAQTDPQGTPTSVAAPVPPRTRIGVRTAYLHIRVGDRLAVAGTLRPGVAGARLALQARVRGVWRTLDRGRTRAWGRYALAVRRRAPLSAPVRVVVRGSSAVRASRRLVGRVNVYSVALASWYGPGLYGNRTGCCGRLGYGSVGVAHKSLPCGTRVTFRHRGRSVRVPVIDRGPYVGAREYDLTAAAARRLGFSGHGAILATR